MSNATKKIETLYRLRKELMELRREKQELADALYNFRTACENIHAECLAVMKIDSTGIKVWAIMQHFKRVWR